MNRLLTMLCALTGLTEAQQASAPKLPPGVPIDAKPFNPDGKPFNDQWYKVFFDRVDWPEARQKCQSMGGQLTVIPNKATWDFVKRLTQKDVWLGATDERKHGEWRWVDGSIMVYSAWRDGEPNAKKGNQNYLVMSGAGNWITVGRSWNYSKPRKVEGYVCQWKATTEKEASASINAVIIEVATWDATSGILTMKSENVKSESRLKSFRVTPKTAITLNGLKSLSNTISPGQKVTGFTQVNGNAEALGSLDLEGVPAVNLAAAAVSPKREPHIRVTMTVDWAQVICVQGDRLWIENPGGKFPWDLHVNGVDWKPTWEGKKSAAFTQWSISLPSLAGATVTATKIAGRASSVKVTQQPDASNDYTLSVRIDDGHNGAASVEIGLVW